MATVTKPRGTQRPAAAAGGVTLSIGIGLIDPSPFNPRKDFSMEKIDSLAASITAHGLLQPIVVRPHPKRAKRYELVAGHRRLVAATRAGLKMIPAAVRELSDGEAREVALVENLQRADLNAIEEAEGLKAILYPGKPGGPTQVELAARLGCSQGHVANRLRLLGLPAAWRKRIISGEITARHAREVLPYIKHPALLASIEKDMAQATKHKWDIGTAEDFGENLVASAVGGVTQPMDGKQFDRKSGKWVPVFAPTEEEKQQLDLVEVDFGHGDDKVQRAANVTLWKRLQALHAKAWVKEQAAKGKSKGKAAAAKTNGKPRKLTAAQQKAAAAEARRKAAELSARFRRGLYEWKVNWLRYLIARAIGEGLEPGTLAQLLLYFVAGGPAIAAARYESYTFGRILARLCRDQDIKASSTQAVAAVAGLENDEAIHAVAAGLLAAGFWVDKDGPQRFVPAADVEAIAEMLTIDLAAAWKAGPQAGPLSEAYWNLHSKDQLAALIRESHGTIQPARTKADTVRQLMAAKKMPMPKEIVKVKRPR